MARLGIEIESGQDKRKRWRGGGDGWRRRWLGRWNGANAAREVVTSSEEEDGEEKFERPRGGVGSSSKSQAQDQNENDGLGLGAGVYGPAPLLRLLLRACVRVHRPVGASRHSPTRDAKRGERGGGTGRWV